MKKRILLGLLVVVLGSVGFAERVHAEENKLNIAPRVIIDEDNRVQVPNEKLNQEPYRWTVFLDITFQDGTRYYASGAMISKDTVLTCGHALFKSGSGWATDVKVHAGYDGVNNTYYAKSSEILGIPSWTSGGDMNILPDVAAIKLDRNLGDQTGWFPIQKNSALQEEVTLTGYPGTKNKTMWTDTGAVTKLYKHGIGYNADSASGNSGSPVYNRNNELVAIHSGALLSSSQGNHNTGTSFTDEVKKVVDFWVTGKAEVEVSGVSLSDKRLTLEKGNTHQLNATVLPTNAFYKEGKWKSSNASIATVDHQGKVTAKNKGNATITFTTDDNKKEAVCDVTVNGVGHIPVEKIEFSNPDKVWNQEKGDTFSTYSPKFTPSNASNKEYYFTSSNKEVLDLSTPTTDRPRYQNPGMTDIYCHSKDNGQAYKAMSVYVDDHGDEMSWATPIESGVSQNGYFYEQQDVDYFRFTPTESGEYTIDGEVFGGKNSAELNKYWEISIRDKDGNYLYTSRNRNFSYSFEAGETYYFLPRVLKYTHIKDEDYKTDYIFSVFPKGTAKPKPITSIKLDKTRIEMDEGTKQKLQATITPEDTTDSRGIEWTSSDTSVATVTNGEITGVKAGKATITAKTSNGRTATCEVNVNRVEIPVERIELRSYSNEVPLLTGLNSSFNIHEVRAKIYPENATDKTIQWSSSDDSIISISNQGDAKAHKEGSVTITARIGDVVGELKMTAVNCAEKIVINQSIDPGASYEEEIQLPYGEGKIDRIVIHHQSNNGAMYWRGNARMEITSTTMPDPLFHDEVSPGYGYAERPSFSGGKLKVRVYNTHQYFKSEVKIEIRAFSLNWDKDWYK